MSCLSNWAVWYLGYLSKKDTEKVSDILIKGAFCQKPTRIKGRIRGLQAGFCVSLCGFSPASPNEWTVVLGGGC